MTRRHWKSGFERTIMTDYKKDGITLPGAIAMGTGVMIGAGILALTGHMAELAGPLFPLFFIAGAIVERLSLGRRHRP